MAFSARRRSRVAARSLSEMLSLVGLAWARRRQTCARRVSDHVLRHRHTDVFTAAAPPSDTADGVGAAASTRRAERAQSVVCGHTAECPPIAADRAGQPRYVREPNRFTADLACAGYPDPRTARTSTATSARRDHDPRCHAAVP